MTQADAQSTSASGKGKAFFDRADQVAETGNWDFAIEMYLEGIQREPDNLDRGHKPLREVSLKRKAQGGKGPGLKDQLTRRGGKDPLARLANAEYLLAKEPGSVAYMEQVLVASEKLALADVTNWICDILLESQRQAAKPSKRILTLLTQSFHNVEDYVSAIQACQMALQLTPDDNKLNAALNELSAKYTIQKGGYGEEGDFTKGVKDMEKQKELAQKDSLVQTESYIKDQIERLRQEYNASPAEASKVNAFVDALLKIEDESYENEAISVLDKAHRDSDAYPFKMRIGDIKIRQMTRRFRKLHTAGDKAAAAKQARMQLAFELEEFAERVANYPTELAMKFELGRRQYLAGQFDEAIASLQHAQRDPRRAAKAMNLLGQAFAKKGWQHEAAETFGRALEGELSEDRAKEIRYNFGGVLEEMGEMDKAQDQFSQVAQLDYNYKDVRSRLENIRKKVDEGGGE